jgi:hypothetical protein
MIKRKKALLLYYIRRRFALMRRRKVWFPAPRLRSVGRVRPPNSFRW